MAAYRRVYDSRHLQADCQEPGSAPEPYTLCDRVSATLPVHVTRCDKTVSSRRPTSLDNTIHGSGIVSAADVDRKLTEKKNFSSSKELSQAYTMQKWYYLVNDTRQTQTSYRLLRKKVKVAHTRLPSVGFRS